MVGFSIFIKKYSSVTLHCRTCVESESVLTNKSTELDSAVHAYKHFAEYLIKNARNLLTQRAVLTEVKFAFKENA